MSNKISSNKQQLNEIRLTWAGKLFFAGIAAKLAAVGLRKLASSMSEQNEEGDAAPSPDFPFKLKGTPEQLEAVQNVVRASVEYQQELKREGATVESVMQKLSAQNQAKIDFKNKTGYDWPL